MARRREARQSSREMHDGRPTAGSPRGPGGLAVECELHCGAIPAGVARRLRDGLLASTPLHVIRDCGGVARLK
jgi:hypothetical protein